MSNNSCKLCTKPIDLKEYIPRLPIPKLMAKYQLCFNCAFWTHRLAEDRMNIETAKSYVSYIDECSKPEFIIPMVMNGEHMSISSKKANSGNSIFLLTKDGKIYNPSQVYYQGKIPTHFIDKFPNDTIELTQSELDEIRSLVTSKGLSLSHITVPQNVVQKMFDKFYKSK